MSDIFISYASEDRDRAERLAAGLQGLGWSIWWDRTIPAGRTFTQVITDALAATRCVLVLWSGKSMKSNWVLEEAEEGRKREILVPVMIENVTPPLGFRSIQAVDLVNWDDQPESQGFRKLVTDITLLIGAPKQVEKSRTQVPPEVIEDDGPGSLGDSNRDVDDKSLGGRHSVQLDRPAIQPATIPAVQLSLAAVVLGLLSAGLTLVMVSMAPSFMRTDLIEIPLLVGGCVFPPMLFLGLVGGWTRRITFWTAIVTSLAVGLLLSLGTLSPGYPWGMLGWCIILYPIGATVGWLVGKVLRS